MNVRDVKFSAINTEISVLWDVAPCTFIATTRNHIPEYHDLNFINTLTDIFKMHVCVCVCVCEYIKDNEARGTTLLYMQIKKSCKILAENFKSKETTWNSHKQLES